jgi:hypothetical protein
VYFFDNMHVVSLHLTHLSSMFATHRPLPPLSREGWTGWWYKAFLFSEEARLKGRVLYIDLDTILCSSSIACLLSLSPGQLLLPCEGEGEEQQGGEGRREQGCSSEAGCVDKSHFFFACLGAKWLRNEGVVIRV